MAMANRSRHGRWPYATFIKCPSVVPQRDAKARLPSSDIDLNNSINVMRHYHHTVLFDATPSREFTKWCPSGHNLAMQIRDLATLRRANLQRFLDTKFPGNKSTLARLLGHETPSYINDLLRTGSGKSFGEKAARRIESAVGLQSGQLDVPNSELLMDMSRRQTDLVEEIENGINDLSNEERQELAHKLAEILGRRKRRRRAS
jgi:hypothetical protein